MDVIFLDIDGVLCTPLSFRLNRLLHTPPERQYFDPVSLYWLRWLVQRSGAEIVLSSSWRDSFLLMDDPICRDSMQNLFHRLSQNGTPLADVTPFLPAGDKGSEIAAWLSCTPCGHFVVLDDNDCFSSCPEVRCHWVRIPNSQGLRRREAHAALQILKK